MNLNSIAFIPDGNRRYALSQGISLLESYKVGTNKAWYVIDWMKEFPFIKTGTFYTLSLKNLERKSIEVKLLFKIFEKELDKVRDTNYFEKNGIKLNFIGKIHLLPKKIQEKIAFAKKKTENNSEKTINLALGYDGQTEIVDAAKKIALAAKENSFDLSQLNEKTFNKFLYSEISPPDLIIRTSGTHRLSGFLTYQSSYSELYFCNKYWPEFSQQDLCNAVSEFEERQRRYGK